MLVLPNITETFLIWCSIRGQETLKGSLPHHVDSRPKTGIQNNHLWQLYFTDSFTLLTVVANNLKCKSSKLCDEIAQMVEQRTVEPVAWEVQIQLQANFFAPCCSESQAIGCIKWCYSGLRVNSHREQRRHVGYELKRQTIKAWNLKNIDLFTLKHH